MTRSHKARVGALSTVLVLTLAACGSASSSPGASAGTASSTEASTPSPTTAESANPTAPPPDLGQAASGISVLSSYVLDIVVNAGDQGTQSISITAVHDPVSAAHYVYGDIEFIVINGQGAWIRQGGTWIDAPGGAGAFQSTFDALAPDNIVANYSLGLYASDLVDVGTEQTNGVETRHFHLDAATAGAGSVGFPADGTMDAQIATDGGYLVSMQYAGTNPETGTRVELSIEVTQVNDPSISIEPPI